MFALNGSPVFCVGGSIRYQKPVCPPVRPVQQSVRNMTAYTSHTQYTTERAICLTNMRDMKVGTSRKYVIELDRVTYHDRGDKFSDIIAYSV